MALKIVRDMIAEDESLAGISWRIVVAHRPIYCGEFWTRSDCRMNLLSLKGFDELYRKYKIDLILNGHMHYYERPYTYDKHLNRAKLNLEKLKGGVIIHEADHPVQLVAGCGGNIEFMTQLPNWAKT